MGYFVGRRHGERFAYRDAAELGRNRVHGEPFLSMTIAGPPQDEAILIKKNGDNSDLMKLDVIRTITTEGRVELQIGDQLVVRQVPREFVRYIIRELRARKRFSVAADGATRDFKITLKPQ
jgi:hypothetical protein